MVLWDTFSFEIHQTQSVKRCTPPEFILSSITSFPSTFKPLHCFPIVLRNTLAKRAFEGTEYECVTDALVGPSLFGFSMEDPGACARLFKDFAKTNDKFEVKVLAVSGQMLGADQLDVLAKLPTREEALAMLMSVMKAPVTKLARTMNEVPGKLVRTLAAVREQKEQAAA